MPPYDGRRVLSRLVSRRTLAVFFLAASALAVAAPPDRITGSIDSSDRVILRGNKIPLPHGAIDRGPLSPEKRIAGVRLILGPSPDQAAALAQLLEQQRDPSSPEYRHWLTPEEFGERFGASDSDLAQLASWLRSAGLTVDETARAKNWIAFSGDAAELARVFHTEFHQYDVNGEAHFSNIDEPSIPAAIAAIVTGIRGLDDFRPPPPRLVQSAPDYTNSSGVHYLAPGDLATIYNINPLYTAGYTGFGQKLAIVGQTDINLADIRAFRSQFGLPALDPQIVLTGPDPGTSPGDEVEADLDLEWSGAIARNATIIYVNSQNVFTSVEYAIDRNLAPVISMSYGGCEFSGAASYRSLAQQANAEGITWLNSSGDSGAAGCDLDATIAQYGPAVVFPADIPEVTAVGGTEFNEVGSTGWSTANSSTLTSVTGYLPEKSWNDTALGDGLEASGGGVSIVFPKPWWQAGPGVPADGARDVPDISLTASALHDGYLIYSGGLMSVGGTSCASPTFAGIVTLLNQYVVAKGAQAKPGLGNINPDLYALAQNTSGLIHDITIGNNIVPCASGSPGCKTGSFGFNAGTGYDMVTGLGSVDAYNLVTKWTSLPPTVGTTEALVASPASVASSGSTQLTATVTAVTGTSAPTGSVTFSLGTTTLGSAALAGAASGAKSTASLAVKSASLTAGTNTPMAVYSPTGNFASSTASTSVFLTAPVATTTIVTANPVTLSSSTNTQITATIKPASGSTSPTGSVTFASGNTTLGSAVVTASGTNGTAVLTVKGSSLANGNNPVMATYAATGNFTGSTGSVTVSVTSPVVATTTTLTASPTSLASSASTQITATVKPASGSAAPAGTVEFSLGGTSLGSVALTASGTTGTASLTVKGTSLAVGSNTVTATYMPTGNFGASAATIAVSLASPLTSTVTSVNASSASLAAAGSANLTVTVKASSGTVAPSGTVTVTSGSVQLGSATLSGSSGSATATVTVKGSSLAAGADTITVTYPGDSSFAGSSTTTTLSVTGNTAAVVVLKATQTTSAQKGWPVSLQVSETAGVAATIAKFTINGTDFSSVIAATFGTTQLAAHGSLSATLVIQWSPLPANLVFVLSGTDANGHAWSQTVTMPT